MKKRLQQILTENNPKRFAAVFAAVVVVLLSSVAALNYVVNPMAQFGSTYFEPIAQTSRAQKLELFDSLQTRPEGMVLGSSRVMKLEPDYLSELTERTFFNAGVNYGKSEDHLAWLRLYQERYKCLPDIVIVGIDPSSFSSTMPPDARLINNPAFARQVPEAISLSDRMKIWEDLFSWDHTKKSVKSLAFQIHGKALPAPKEHYRTDGLLVYDVREKEISEGTYDLQSAIDDNKAEYFPRYLGFTKHSLVRRLMFRDLAVLCRKNGTRLLVYITPMHPQLEEHLNAKTEYEQRRDETAVFLNLLAKKFEYEFFDFAKIESFGGNQQQFVDGTHPLESNTRKIIDIMFAGQQLADEPQANRNAIVPKLSLN